MDGIGVTVWDADIDDSPQQFFAVPGQVIEIGQDRITVACGQGAIRILESEVSGEVEPTDAVVRSIRARFS